MDHNETGCQAPERPILCVNNCGFFGSGATRNMCSKCHKEAVLKEEQAKMAASSIEHIVNGSSNRGEEALVTTDAIDVNQGSSSKTNAVDNSQVSCNSNTIQISQGKKQGPSRCTSCSKRVGLAGFTCRCGNVFCGTHRYSDKHDCPFDYRAAAQVVIAKANPVVKADKLDRI